jgi:hypothetical protein
MATIFYPTIIGDVSPNQVAAKLGDADDATALGEARTALAVETTSQLNARDALQLNLTGGTLTGALETTGDTSTISTNGSSAHISTRSTFKLNNGTHITTLSHAPTANRAIAFPNAGGTVAIYNESGILVDVGGTGTTVGGFINFGIGGSTLDVSGTTNRNWTIPDASGTVMLETLSGVNASTARTNLSAVGSVTTGVTGADAITNMMSLTQAEYNAITPAANTLYVIV